MTFLIVDATAGYRLMWKHKDTRYTVFLDKRRECKPDIVCDNGVLPLRDGVADEIIYDPPHIIENPIYAEKRKAQYPYIHGQTHISLPGNLQASLYHKYHYWPHKTAYIANLYYTNHEFHRILKDQGRIHIKLTETRNRAKPDASRERWDNKHKIRAQQVKELYTDFKITQQTPHKNHCRGLGTVYWLTLKPHQQ